MNPFKSQLLFLLIFAFYFYANIIAQTDSFEKAQSGIDKNIPQKIINNDSSALINLKSNNNLRYDTSDINLRLVDSAKILIHLKEKDFKYFDDPEYSKTLWERLMDWIRDNLAKLNVYKAYHTAWDILIYILMGLAVIAIIFGFYRSEIKGLFFANKNKNDLKISESVEDIHSLDYDALIEDALANKNYRYAIRLNYLRTLKLLSNKQIINWKIDKTNSDFLREINHKSIREKFKRITYSFEYIWYGEFEIDHESYKQLQLDYSDINSSLDKVSL